MALPSDDSFSIASQEVSSLLQQGKDESACADLAKTLIDEVTNAVNQSNKILATLDDGSDCPNEGSEAVNTAQQNKDDADKAAQEAALAVKQANSATVDFSSYSLSSVTEGQCAQFWTDENYKAAKTTATDAATAKTAADAKAAAMVEPLAAAKEQAAIEIKSCQCAARAAYNTALTAASEKAADDDAAFTKGKHMQCVLAGTAAADCSVGVVPKLQAVTLAEGVPAEVCTTPSPTAAPTASPTTSAPTTSAPTTSAPTTSAPTSAPTIGSYYYTLEGFCSSRYKCYNTADASQCSKASVGLHINKATTETDPNYPSGCYETRGNRYFNLASTTTSASSINWGDVVVHTICKCYTE